MGVLMLTGCPSNNSSQPAMRTYLVTVVNTTAHQPLSPLAVQLHSQAYAAWDIGAPATTGLEDLAESGSPVMFLEEGEATAIAEAVGESPVGPGSRVSFMLDGTYSNRPGNGHSLTIASMLVNTNDAYTGVTNWDLTRLAVGESMRSLAPIYDAGTEANTESASTVPGPAAGGEGYNATRDDTNYVTRHSGVVTADDGLGGSALNESHRFDNGAMSVVVTRLN